MEIWDLYDCEGKKLNKTAVRGTSIDEGDFHLVVHIIIRNSNGEYLIQKRAETKELFPGLWAFTGGSAIVGESSEIAAIRELSEETGISLETGKLLLLKRLFLGSSMADIWYAEVDVDVTSLEFQVEEVSALAFESKEKIEKMIIDRTFHKYRDEYIQTVFNIGGNHVR